jgi:hypothetical protein
MLPLWAKVPVMLFNVKKAITTAILLI